MTRFDDQCAIAIGRHVSTNPVFNNGESCFPPPAAAVPPRHWRDQCINVRASLRSQTHVPGWIARSARGSAAGAAREEACAAGPAPPAKVKPVPPPLQQTSTRRVHVLLASVATPGYLCATSPQ